MNQLDMRTVLLSYVLSNAICMSVMASLWLLQRRRSDGLGLWMADFVMQFIAVALLALRGVIPAPVSILLVIPLVLTGTILLYQGLERYTGYGSPHRFNYLLLTVASLVHFYFAFVKPSLFARNINFSIALLAICLQCAWLMLRRVNLEMRPDTRMVGFIFCAYSLFSLVRVFVLLAVPPGEELFTTTSNEVFVIMAYQMLFVGLTFSLFLMVNRRLFRALALDITERGLVQEALRESEEKFELAFRTSPYSITISRLLDGRFIELNEAFCSISGYSREEAMGRTAQSLSLWVHEEDRDRTVAKILSGQKVVKEEGQFRRKDGQIITGLFSAELMLLRNEKCILSSIADISDRKQAEEEREKLQATLTHAQKMESIGRLAGGVAHDFNNLLTVINGYSEMLLAELSAGDPLRARLTQICRAGERAAVLTRQLLAYSRKQLLQPRELDLNLVVQEMLPMLERLMGEDVGVCVELDAECAMVHADLHQLEQVIMNLAINARDAMPNGGELLIQTAHVERDESSARLHPEAREGRFVMLAVTDSGIGMDAETRQRIFEPFFTTKEFGKGTGLGLSMAQGIVAQSGGYIDVTSAVGQGTTFRTYLPALAGVTKEVPSSSVVPGLEGHETVLVVEDQPEVRNFAVAVLNQYGYRTIQAEDADAALLACDQEPELIHLVLTDVVMPKLNGRELADRLEKLRPGIKVLFMSGYPQTGIAGHRVLHDGDEFIQKPFSPEELARKVRGVLGSHEKPLRTS